MISTPLLSYANIYMYIPSVVYVVEQVSLTVLTALPLGPPAAVPAGASEGRISAQKDVHDHSQGPHVAPECKK